jgi:hypothetical protein
MITLYYLSIDHKASCIPLGEPSEKNEMPLLYVNATQIPYHEIDVSSDTSDSIIMRTNPHIIVLFIYYLVSSRFITRIEMCYYYCSCNA